MACHVLRLEAETECYACTDPVPAGFKVISESGRAGPLRDRVRYLRGQPRRRDRCRATSGDAHGILKSTLLGHDRGAGGLGSAAVIVLDTHAWIWWVGRPQLLSESALQRIDRAMDDGSIYISSISCWEISLLIQKGRLELTRGVEDWIADSEALPFFQFVPIDNHIALRSTRLPGDLHQDPADRIIIATARFLGATLVTKDRKIRNYPHVETLW